jgi:hypothetical protein
MQIAFDFWNFLGGLIAGGLGGALLTLKFTRSNRVIGSGNAVDQSRSSAGGDIVGRDKRR